MDDVCLGKTGIETKKEMSAEITVKSTGFRDMIGAWLLTHQLPQKLLCWQASLVVSLVSKWGGFKTVPD